LHEVHRVPFRLLVVEDSRDIRTLMVRLLAAAGYEVDTAEDGAVAIEKLAHGSYDAVTLDLMMPRVDGFAVLEYMGKNAPEMIPKTILATAWSDRARTHRIAGTCTLVSKPFDVSELLDAVASCIS
jgi:CheY-like chemotaxis protein